MEAVVPILVAVTSPISVLNSLIPAEILVATKPVKVLLPIWVSCSLIAVTTVVAVVPKFAAVTLPMSVINSLSPSMTVVETKLAWKVWVGSTLAFRVSISTSNSDTASVKLVAVVPILAALTSPASVLNSRSAAEILRASKPVKVILPMSLSCSLIASASVTAVVVNVVPMSVKVFRESISTSNSDTASVRLDAVVPILAAVTSPMSVINSLRPSMTVVET